MTTYAQQVEGAIDLKSQIAGLYDPGDSDFLFQDTSPPTRWETVYSTETGEPIPVKRHRVIATLQKRLPNGAKAFTARQEDVPEYRLGTVKCFLAKGSKERARVDELNISPGYYCIAEHLANEGAAEVHAEKRHPTRWRQYKALLDREERQRDRERQDAQTAAILSLAQSKTGEVALEERPVRLGRPPKDS